MIPAAAAADGVGACSPIGGGKGVDRPPAPAVSICERVSRATGSVNML